MSDTKQAKQQKEEPDSTAPPSRPFTGNDWSENSNVQHLINVLFDEYRQWYKAIDSGRRIRDSERIRQHLTHFALEAFRTHRALPELSMGVHLGNSYYNDGSGRYHPKHLSYRVVRNVTDFLVSSDYLEMPSGKGGWHPNEFQRRTTRFRATRKLLDLCNDFGIGRHMIVPYGNPEIIILRARKLWGHSHGDLIDYVDTSFTRNARNNLERINSFIEKHRIDLDITDDQEAELFHRLRGGDEGHIDYTKVRLIRIFNNSSFEQGGRFYGGWWQKIPSDYRVFITIDGKRTVQLDYSGMHFAIMYAQLGMNAPRADPYALDGYGGHLRKDIKKAFNIIINCSTREEATSAIDRRISDGKLSPELISGERILNAFENAHPLIKSKIASGEGVRGQFVDSRVAERVLLKGIDMDLCILPIHDGFITTRGDEFVLARLMDDSFREVTGHTVKLKPESFDLNVLPESDSNGPHWITRPDGTVERDTPRRGTAIAHSEIIPAKSLWRRIEEEQHNKKNRINRDREWKSVHDHR